MQTALVRFRKTVAAVRAFLAPEAFEQRERDRQRAQAVETLDVIQTMRAWCDGAERFNRERLDKLNAIELGYDPKCAARWANELQPPAPGKLPHGEYERVPRTLREAFGHGCGLEAVDSPSRMFTVAAVFFAVCVGAAICGALWFNL